MSEMLLLQCKDRKEGIAAKSRLRPISPLATSAKGTKSAKKHEKLRDQIQGNRDYRPKARLRISAHFSSFLSRSFLRSLRSFAAIPVLS
jgi:hypothetical protein